MKTTEEHKQAVLDAAKRLLACEYNADETHPNGRSARAIDEYYVAKEYLQVQKELAELSVKEGPLNSERWTLGELIAELEKWKQIASEKTCVSFENIVFGASSLWHQNHRENFRAVDKKPEALSRWILAHEGSVHEDFPAQVLSVLERLSAAVLASTTENTGNLDK